MRDREGYCRSRAAWSVLALVLFSSACSGHDKATTQTTTKTTTAPSCSAGTATPTQQYPVGVHGFVTTCGRVKRGTAVYFVSEATAAVTVEQRTVGPDRFSTQLPRRGSTLAHVFKTPGTYLVTAGPASNLTLYVTR